MNQRIKELFLQAGFHPPVVKRMGDEYKFEKFAELIVKECAKHAEHAKGIDVEFEAYFKAMINGVEE